MPCSCQPAPLAPPLGFPQLGGKGANLCEMARLGVNIPAGFTITTEGAAARPGGHRAQMPPR